MRLAVYNVENLFDRARAMNIEKWADGKVVLDKFAKLNSLLGKVAYSGADKTRIAGLVVELGLGKSDSSEFVILGVYVRHSQLHHEEEARAAFLSIGFRGELRWLVPC
jgi:hypothetical protein